MGAHVCMWLRCVERPIALVGIAPRLCTAGRAHALLYGHAPMELASLLTAAANGAGEHTLSMRCALHGADMQRTILILHIMADHPLTYVCHIRSLRWLPELVSESSVHYALPKVRACIRSGLHSR